MNTDSIEKYLEQHQFLITLIFIPALGLIWFIIKYLWQQWKDCNSKILINFSLAQTAVNPNPCLTYLKITNNKSKKIIANKIELVLFDKTNIYSIDVYNKSFTVEPEAFIELNIEPVSYYCLGNEFVDIKNLFLIEKNFYLILHNGDKKTYINKKWLFRKKIHNNLKPSKLKFENEIHSADWDYGFVYTDETTSMKHVGFMNKRQIVCEHIFDISVKDTYNPQFLLQILTQRGFTNLSIRPLIMEDREYTQIIPRVLGDVSKTIQKNKTLGTRENPIHISKKDVLSFTKKTN
jgi:hypothetical protein